MRSRVFFLLVIALSAAACDAHISIRGTVKDRLGAGIEGVSVELKAVEGDSANRASSASDGSFRVNRIYGFGSSRFVLAVSKQGYKTLVVELEPAQGYTCEIILSRDEEVTASVGSCRPRRRTRE